jgi:hypothetical protein
MKLLEKKFTIYAAPSFEGFEPLIDFMVEKLQSELLRLPALFEKPQGIP